MKNIALALLALCATMHNTNVSAQNPGDKRDMEIAAGFETFFNTYQVVNNMYVDTTKPKKLTEDAINAMLDKLDPYTEYINEDAQKDFEFHTTGKYAGIGSTIVKKGNWIEIAEPYENTPATNIGLKAGDRLVKIDTTSLKNMSDKKVSNMLKGDPKTSFELTYVPIKDTNSTKIVTIQRETIKVPAVQYSGMIDDSVGYITLSSFTENSAKEVKHELIMLKKNPEFKGLILDLRGNTGGSVAESVDILSLFIPKNSVAVILKGRGGKTMNTYRTKTEPIAPKLPLVVLTNSLSASASEIVAGALQDIDRAVIVGDRSFGKGLVQTTRDVGKNQTIKITIAKYYTPAGRCIQALDYKHRREDGSVEHVPDSLKKEFKTSGGRIVYDGGGIKPDVRVEPQYWSKFAAIISAFGFVDDFANSYAAHNEPKPIKTFKVSEKIYQDFVKFMQNKTIKYKPQTLVALEKLEEKAENDKYLDKIKPLIDSIKNKITDDKNKLLVIYKVDVKEVLTSAIITRWHFRKGAIKYATKYNTDNTIKKAVKILQNNVEYNDLLTENHTK